MRRRSDLEKKLQFYYEREKAKTTVDMATNDDPTIQKLWEKQYDVTRYFTRDFMPAPWTPRTGLAGKIVIAFKRLFRKGTVYIFEQFSAFLYQFESRLMELLGLFIQFLAALDGRVSKVEIFMKEQAEQIRKQQQTLIKAQEDQIQKQEKQIQAQRKQMEFQSNQILDQQAQIEKQTSQLKDQQVILADLKKLIGWQSVRVEEQEQISKDQANQISSLDLQLTMAQKEFQQTDNLRRQHILHLETQLQSAQLQVIQLVNMLTESKDNGGHAPEQNAEKILPIRYTGRNDGFYSYAQCGEDGILNYLLFVMQRREPKSIRYLDIGCNDFRCDNNTYFLYQRGAAGIDIDANPVCVESVKKNRARDTVINAGVGSESAEMCPFYVMSNYGLSSFSKACVENAIAKNPENRIDQVIDVPIIGINALMKEYFPDTPPTVLSIDAEGVDIQILRALNYNLYRPEIIIVETIDYVPWIALEKNRDEIINILEPNGYVEYAFTGVNSIFLDSRIMQ